MSEENIYRDMVLPVRIGDKSSVSQKVKPWQLEEFVKNVSAITNLKLRLGWGS